MSMKHIHHHSPHEAGVVSVTIAQWHSANLLAPHKDKHIISVPHLTTPGSSHMPRKKARVNKMDLIREALGTLGKGAMPLDIQKSVKDKHGVELSTSLISNYKSYLLTK